MDKTSAKCGLQLSFSVLLGVLLVLGKVASNPPPNRVQYVAIIDAGSTGSRIIIYRFTRNGTGQDVQLHKSDFFSEIKPGLSAYVDNIEAGVESIAKLLKEARTHIPDNRLDSTPLVLRATAGMRLAAPEKADLLMKAIEDLVAKSGFRVDANAVQIMKGSDEGIFSWLTVNFLTGRLGQIQTKQLAAMDLGGGSMQITLPIVDAAEASQYGQDVRRLHVAGRDIDVFTHSYLGAGFQAARHAILTDGNTTEGTALQSACVNPQVVNASWSFNNVQYQVSGKQHEQETAVSIAACADLIRKNVISKINPRPVTLRQHQLAAWNKFFAVTFHLSKRDEFGVGSLRKKAEKECAKYTDKAKNVFQCLNLIYTSTLLTEGFGLPEDITLIYSRKIHGHFVSWTLGCALNVINFVTI